eukprot:2084678-Rhodomonas_salina.1
MQGPCSGPHLLQIMPEPLQSLCPAICLVETLGHATAFGLLLADGVQTAVQNPVSEHGYKGCCSVAISAVL